MNRATNLLRDRTKKFALRVIRLAQSLPDDKVSRVISNQLLRSGTSVGSNYRAACRARSPADFCNKLNVVEEETDESMYWMELVMESELMPTSRVSALYREAEEILKMTVASINTSRKGVRHRAQR